MPTRRVLWFVTFGAAVLLIVLHESCGPSSPRRLAQLYLGWAQAGDLDRVGTLLRPGKLDELVMEAAERKLKPVRDVFDRAMVVGFQEWADLYSRQLVSGSEAHRRAMSEIEDEARSRFGNLSDEQREQMTDPASRARWMAGIASRVLSQANRKLAGDLTEFVQGRPASSYILDKGWAAMEDSNVRRLDRRVFSVDPFAAEFSVRGRDESASIAGALGETDRSILSRLWEENIYTLRSRITEQLVPKRSDIQEFSVEKGMDSASDEDKATVRGIKFAQLQDQGFLRSQGKVHLTKLLRQNYAEVRFQLQRVMYSNQASGLPTTGRFLRGTDAVVNLDGADSDGNSFQRQLNSFRDGWHWKLEVNNLNDILWRQ